jgi:hypothetical protein
MLALYRSTPPPKIHPPGHLSLSGSDHNVRGLLHTGADCGTERREPIGRTASAEPAATGTRGQMATIAPG